MALQNIELFLGVPIDKHLELNLSQVNPHLLSLFVDNKSDYLHRFVYGGTTFLGKSIGDKVDTALFELLAANILSILHRLVPDYSGTDADLFLVPVLHH